MAEENRFSSIQFNERFDIVVLGARLHAPRSAPPLRAAVHDAPQLPEVGSAGRVSKLAAVRARCEKAAEATQRRQGPGGCGGGAAERDATALRRRGRGVTEAVAGRARLVLNCTGPYRFFGLPVVAAACPRVAIAWTSAASPSSTTAPTCTTMRPPSRLGCCRHAAAWDSVPGTSAPS